MTFFRNGLAALLLLVLPSHLAAAPVRDWSQVAARTPTGAFVQGNPRARVKLTEYLSLTCPHCALFEAEGIAPLTAKYVRPGLVSYEVRHALRDGFDFAGAMLARCNGPQAFFTTLPNVYARQDDWFSRARAWSQVEQADGLPVDQLLPKLARGAGFDMLFAMPAARMDGCLANQDEQKILTDMAAQAWALPKFPGTPAFAIDGVLRPDIHSWTDLDAALRRALHLRPSPRKTAHK